MSTDLRLVSVSVGAAVFVAMLCVGTQAALHLDVDCVALHACRYFGKCTAQADGRCAAATNDDCLQSTVCVERGFCLAQGGGCHMPAAVASDCFVPHGALFFEPCAEGGLCDLVEGTCRRGALRDAECQTSWWSESGPSECATSGACRAIDGVCRANGASDCKQAEICQVHGRCDFVEGECVANSDADCQRSKGCVNEGRCWAKAGVCFGTLDDCLKIRACFDEDLACQVAEGDLIGRCEWPGDSFEF